MKADIENPPQRKTSRARLERVLENEPFVLNADVYIGASGRLHIDLQQREALIRIIDNKGGNYFLDVDGVRFPPSPHFSPRVLVATGDIQPFTPDYRERKRHTLQDLFALAHRLREEPFLDALIEQVHVRGGNLVLVPKMGNQKINFGSYELVEDKLKRLYLFYEEALPYEGWRAYKTIDLRYRGQVVCQRW
jgi:cell division protein FtsQ